jgi:hypothetical protein
VAAAPLSRNYEKQKLLIEMHTPMHLMNKEKRLKPLFKQVLTTLLQTHQLDVKIA